MAAKSNPANAPMRTLDARPDTVDFRDRMYIPPLVEVPPRIELAAYRALKVPILDQGSEGACTGFGLATVANYLLQVRRVDPDATRVSPRMFYEMARRYDEWPGEEYEGSSARGAMKGWHKHGVCSEKHWPYHPTRRGKLTAERVSDARSRPLGAYFRVNHRDLVAMHSAITEVGILYATAVVHEGWEQLDSEGVIPRRKRALGGHAFAIVAYNARGFWLQNSWGDQWGAGGFALLSYDDWLENGSDVWVARLGAPLELASAEGVATSFAGTARAAGYTFEELRPHVISIGNDGRLRHDGTYASPPAQVRAIFEDDIPRITKGWKKRRILLYAHGGLVNEDAAIQRIAEYRAALLEAEVYPLGFVWKSDFWSTLTNILADALGHRRSEGLLDASKDFMLDRLDDALEPLARQLTGKLLWDEMKENALAATTAARGGAREVADRLAALPEAEIHLVGHSAGSILHAPLVQYLATKGKIAGGPLKGRQGKGLAVASCTLWAPACTVELFNQTYLPLIKKGAVARFHLFTLTDKAEQDDQCAGIYNKSLLYLVSNALEARPRVPLLRDGVPLLGMQKFVDDALAKLLSTADHRWVLAPNAQPSGRPDASRARSHGAFDDDRDTVKATLALVLGGAGTGQPVRFERTRSGIESVRRRLNQQLAPGRS